VIWDEWFLNPRMKDLANINFLRRLDRGVDPRHSSFLWDISQNVDRQGSARPGIAGCVTPHGLLLHSSRGGPLLGKEMFELQGIPTQDLQFTCESEEELRDMAGNAMSTTVVGACELAVLLALMRHQRGSKTHGHKKHSPSPQHLKSSLKCAKVASRQKTCLETDGWVPFTQTFRFPSFLLFSWKIWSAATSMA